VKEKEGKMQVEHSSVLLERCVTLLTPSIEKSQTPIVVDATLGLGGHSFALLEKFPQLRIVGLDRDLKAIDKATQRLSKFSDRITVIHAVYDEMPKVLDSLGISNVDGILFDLGVSSMQLDNPAPARRVGGNPAKRTFQALRIEVNQELSVLERAIPRAMDRLTVGGRLVVMSFQSLEDKIVKRYFTAATESKTPIGLPVEISSLAAKFELVFRGSEKASDAEIQVNSRAQSVRLRAIERVAS